MINQFLLDSFLLVSLSKALDHYLKLDPDSAARLKKLNGKTATIEWLPFHLVFQCCFNENSVRLHAGELLISHVKISATPWQMMRMLLANERQKLSSASGIKIAGEIDTAQLVLALFDELQWDGEEYLSRFVGDVPAYHAARTAKQLKNWWQRAKSSFCDNVNEYLHEEINLFPAKEALSDFFVDVDKLRMDVDRIEARVNRLILSEFKNT